MTHVQLEPRDHYLHALRNRALLRVLESMLRAELSRSNAKRAGLLARRRRAVPWERMPCDMPRRWPRGGHSPLRLVKTSNR